MSIERKILNEVESFKRGTEYLHIAGLEDLKDLNKDDREIAERYIDDLLEFIYGIEGDF